MSKSIERMLLDDLILQLKGLDINKQEDVAKSLNMSREHFSRLKKSEPAQLDELIRRHFKISHSDKIVEELGAIRLSEDQKVTLEKPKVNYLIDRRSKKNSGVLDDNTAPFVPVKAQAGYSHAYDQSEYIDSFERYALPPNITKHGAIWRYWEISGESMLPTFKHKDVILTSQVHEMDWDQLRNFYCYVIVTDEHVLFKRIAQVDGRWIAISDNEDNGYEQFEIDPKTVKEVWVFRRHIDSSAPVPKEFKIKI